MDKGKNMAREELDTVAIEPLSPVSQLLSSPETFIVITFGSKTRLNLSSFVEGLNNTLINAPRLNIYDTDYKKNGEPVWIPVSVRVEDHVIVPDLEYRNIDNPDQLVEDYTSNLANIPMDMSKPLWEFHFLDIKTSNAESIAIAKIHHSIGDGMSLVSLLVACARKTSEPSALTSTTTATAKPVTSMSSARWLFSGFLLMMMAIFSTIVDVFKTLLTILFLRDTKNPLMANPNNGIRSWKTVNDVLLGMTQAGLSRYLSRNYDGYTMSEKKKTLEKIRVRGSVPVNLRPATKIEMGKLGVYPLWIKVEDDPLEYIRRAKTIMDRKKISLEAFILYGIIKFTSTLFGKKVEYAYNGVQEIGARIFGHTTMTISNVKGPQEEINKIVINLAVDTTTISDPHLLCDDLVDSLKIIKSAVREKRFHNGVI
ncbi:hypothetical protein HID58_013528 [Brassica napus]|uniref:Diacylglycerol O-acyltransferase n=1 Tax=Brassica napus TaxID=3708 RepID=A0ABQ8E6X2_BRANA|nr:hypothetical protein HID58_013528 [Brassica napus]